MADDPQSWFLHAKPGAGHLANGGARLYETITTRRNVCNRRPNVVHEDWKIPRHRALAESKLPWRKAAPAWSPREKSSRAACIDVTGQGNPVIDRYEASNPAEKQTRLQSLDAKLNETPGNNRRRIFLLECTDPEFVEVFGNYFRMDPAIFARHQRTGIWEFRHIGGNTPPLPASRNNLNSFMMEYSQLRYFSKQEPAANVTLPNESPFQTLSARNPLDHRHIGVTKVTNKMQSVGILHRKATYWAKTYPEPGNSSWDVLFIVDPPLPDNRQTNGVTPPSAQNRWPGRYEHLLIGDSKNCVEERFYGEPYQGGYQDFLAMDNVLDNPPFQGPQRISIFDDLLHYWQHHSAHAHVGAHPISSTFFLQKIVASEYNLLIEYLRGALCETEWFTQFRHPEFRAAQIERQWSDMQSWATRCREYNDFVDDIIERRDLMTQRLNPQPNANIPVAVNRPAPASAPGIGDPADAPAAADAPVVPAMNNMYIEQWEECCADFQSIQSRMRKIRDRCDLLVTSYDALAGMVGNRQAVMEAKRVTVLTILAMIFLPMSFIVGLFGTNPPWAPGQAEAWKLYVSMGSTTGGVILLALLMHFGFTDEGQWRLARVIRKIWLSVFSVWSIFTKGWGEVTKSRKDLTFSV